MEISIARALEKIQPGKEVIWVDPIIENGCECDSDSYEKIVLHFELPNVDDESIHVHVSSKDMHLVAKIDEKTKYMSMFQFDCAVDPNQARALLKDDILRLEVHHSCERL